MIINIEYDSIEEHDYLKPLIKEWSMKGFNCWIRPSPILRNRIYEQRKRLALLKEEEKRKNINDEEED